MPAFQAGNAGSNPVGATALNCENTLAVDRIPAPTDEQLERLSPNRIFIVGGPRAVSRDVEEELGTYEAE